MFIMTWMSVSADLLPLTGKPARVKARTRDSGSSQPGAKMRQPCHEMSARPRSLSSPVKKRERRSVGCSFRKAISSLVKRIRSACSSARFQSNQVISLSWQ